MGSQVQVDDGTVRVTRWTLAPGEATGPHEHEHDYVVVPLTDASMRVTEPDGSSAVHELAPGSSYARRAGARHDVSNAGQQVLDFVEVEVLT